MGKLADKHLVLQLLRRHLFRLLQGDGMVLVPLENFDGIACLQHIAAELGRTLHQDFDETESFGLDTLLDGTDDLPEICGAPPGHIRGAGRHGDLNRVHGILDIAVRGGRRHGPHRGCGRHLAAGHAIDGIIEHDGRHIEIAAAGMEKMVAADGHAVAVSGEADKVEIRPGELHARGHGEDTAVVGVDVVPLPEGIGDTARTAHALNPDRILRGQCQFVAGDQG